MNKIYSDIHLNSRVITDIIHQSRIQVINQSSLSGREYSQVQQVSYTFTNANYNSKFR